MTISIYTHFEAKIEGKVRKLIIHQFEDGRESKRVDQFIAKAYLDLEESGLGMHDYHINWSGGFFAELDGKIIGIITHSTPGPIDFIWINLAYILPEFRGIEIYERLYNVLKDYVREKGWLGIRSGIHPDNASMIKAAEKTGRKLNGLIYDWKNPSRGV